jgi:hypothetical protein
MIAAWTAIFLSRGAAAELANGTGLQVSVAGDMVGTFGSGVTNRLDPREAEILFYAPTDYLFDGQMSAAAHNENGAFKFELHELFISSSKLIPRSRFRAGKFFLGVGRLNSFHRHDWPFISAPKVHASFFDDEAASDTGLEYSYLFPTPFYLDLTVGVTNGWTYGHADDLGTRPYFPTHYARLASFQSLFSDGGCQFALNYLGRKDGVGEMVSLMGIDATAKWKEGPLLKTLIQSEFWYQIRSPLSGNTTRAFGFYIYPQYGLSNSWSLGVRFDGYKDLTLKDANDVSISNFDYGIIPTLTFKPSEFSTIRAAYNLLGSYQGGTHTNGARAFEIQAVFILGSHPAHDF